MKKAVEFLLLLALSLDFSQHVSCVVINEHNPVVSVTQGQIRGKMTESRDGRKYVEFLGIPYARNPPQRFKVAEPPELWEGIRDGTTYRNNCIQANPDKNSDKNAILGSEECLFLNLFVYRPTSDSSSKKLLPVMVFLNDDNFQNSKPTDFYGAQYFMDEPVILVQINYRLGIFGFLTTGKGNAKILPGNLGLKDQVEALRWIQGNIHVFGGDRFRVTLFGSGSGSVAVSLHLLSPMSSGLFASGISQGGTILCPNSFVLDPASFTAKLGVFLKCPVNLTDTRFEVCLREKDVEDIIQFQNKMTGWAQGQLVMPVGPSVEFLDDGFDEENLFLPDFPENILKSGTFNKLPYILGCNSKSGYFPNVAVLRKNSSYLEALNENWEKYAPLLFDYGLTSRSPTFISRKVHEFYFAGDDQIGHNNLDQLYDALSDHNFFQCTRHMAMLYGRFAPTFLYYFTYERPNFMQKSETNGVGQLGELQNLFKLNPNSKQQSQAPQIAIMRRSQSYKFSTSLIRLWISFAKDGYDQSLPTETWPQREAWLPLSKSQVNGKSPMKWYHLDTETKSISEPFFPHLLEFWQKLDTNFKVNILANQYSIKLNERQKRERKRRLNMQFGVRGTTSDLRSTWSLAFFLLFIVFSFIL